jgi:septum formation protein
VRPAGVEELGAGAPAAVVAENALRKARAVQRAAGEVVLGVDTIVATPQRIWGKPADEEAARETLRALSGRTHDVVSGLALIDAHGVRCATAVTRVTFRALDDAGLERYVAAGEWRERAGGYAIQGRGALLVQRIEGDYLNVVGLPVATLCDLAPELFTE